MRPILLARRSDLSPRSSRSAALDAGLPAPSDLHRCESLGRWGRQLITIRRHLLVQRYGMS